MTDNYVGNITTIVKWVSMYIAGWTIGTLTAYGLNLPVDSTTLSQVIFGLIMLGVGYVDSKYPNTFKFLGNDEEMEIEDIDPAGEYENLNENYEDINEYDDIGDEEDVG